MRNKPNWAPVRIGAKYSATKKLGAIRGNMGTGKTKPIRPLRMGGQTCRLRPAQANCAKRTQWPAGEIPTIPSFQYSKHESIVRNEANWHKRSPGKATGLSPFFRFFRLSPVRLRPDVGRSRASPSRASGSSDGSLRHRFVRNEANWGRPRPPDAARPYQTKPIGARERSPYLGVVRNEANSDECQVGGGKW